MGSQVQVEYMDDLGRRGKEGEQPQWLEELKEAKNSPT